MQDLGDVDPTIYKAFELGTWLSIQNPGLQIVIKCSV